MGGMTLGGQSATRDEGLGELDALLGVDVDQPGAALALANSEASVDLLAALREARARCAISEADLVERLGAAAHLVLDEVEHLGGDPRLSSLRRYAGAIGARLEVGVSTAAPAHLDE